eukprot:TRINITY_DN2399_c0_g1_i1.p1 TRINITY_DN2399_c0_g1~~TRINITY_DN2399_c0_g1_i1.p1  ORF type:complete len:121 (-),score=28.95 TRINITY_DN2399_c0_g1_i1:23-385(-)
MDDSFVLPATRLYDERQTEFTFRDPGLSQLLDDPPTCSGWSVANLHPSFSEWHETHSHGSSDTYYDEIYDYRGHLLTRGSLAIAMRDARDYGVEIRLPQRVVQLVSTADFAALAALAANI